MGIISLIPYHRIHLRLSSPWRFSGTIRIVLRGKRVEIHYTEEEDCPDPKPESRGEKFFAPTQRITGIDKGFGDVLMDSEGNSYGEEQGKILRAESDRLGEKNKKRNQIWAVAEKANKKGNLEKAARIRKNNLGKKKYARQKWAARKRIKTYIGTAVHKFFQQKQPEIVVGENLNFNHQGKTELPRKVKRYFSGWLKGVMQETIEMRCLRSGAAYASVNAAYTSQVCSFCGCFGKRNGNTFHCLNARCGRVVNAHYIW
ncbi:MAG: transposase [Nitrospinae bacterium]|nr:transposase [Nitrospinota bacterium]